MEGKQFLQIFMLSACVLSTVVAALVWARPRTGLLPFIALPALMLLVFIGVLQAAAQWTSTQPMVAELHASVEKREVFLFKVFEHQSSLPFYLKKPVRVVESRSSDLFWGIKLHKNDIVVSDTTFDKITNEQLVSLVVLDEDLVSFNDKKYAHKFKNSKKIGRSTLFMN